MPEGVGVRMKRHGKEAEQQANSNGIGRRTRKDNGRRCIMDIMSSRFIGHVPGPKGPSLIPGLPIADLNVQSSNLSD